MGSDWYTVKKIHGHRKVGRNKYQYQIEWDGFDYSGEYFVPIDMARNRVYRDYCKKHGLPIEGDDQHLPDGT